MKSLLIFMVIFSTVNCQYDYKNPNVQFHDGNSQRKQTTTFFQTGSRGNFDSLNGGAGASSYDAFAYENPSQGQSLPNTNIGIPFNNQKESTTFGGSYQTVTNVNEKVNSGGVVGLNSFGTSGLSTGSKNTLVTNTFGTSGLSTGSKNTLGINTFGSSGLNTGSKNTLGINTFGSSGLSTGSKNTIGVDTFGSGGSVNKFGSNYVKQGGVVVDDRFNSHGGQQYSTIKTQNTGFSSGGSNYHQRYNVKTLEPKVVKHFYFHSAPEEPEEAQFRQEIVHQPEKHVKVIFIKVPTKKSSHSAALHLQQNEEKTVVYVLVDEKEDISNLEIPALPPTEPTKPEVYFIKYKSEKEAHDALAPFVVQGEHGASKDSVSTTFISSGTKKTGTSGTYTTNLGSLDSKGTLGSSGSFLSGRFSETPGYSTDGFTGSSGSKTTTTSFSSGYKGVGSSGTSGSKTTSGFSSGVGSTGSYDTGSTGSYNTGSTGSSGSLDYSGTKTTTSGFSSGTTGYNVGTTGSSGYKGVGSTGSYNTGSTGSYNTGSSGSSGYNVVGSGSSGSSAYKGTGSSGSYNTGSSGSLGYNVGSTGSSGSSGYKGTGSSGSGAYTGTSGSSGYNVAGSTGYKGSTGLSGSLDYSGTSGSKTSSTGFNSGSSGYKGSSGSLYTGTTSGSGHTGSTTNFGTSSFGVTGSGSYNTGASHLPIGSGSKSVSTVTTFENSSGSKGTGFEEYGLPSL